MDYDKEYHIYEFCDGETFEYDCVIPTDVGGIMMNIYYRDGDEVYCEVV